MRLYKMDDTVLRVKGNATNFLNGLTSNAMDALFNAFLNQHGRIITTFFQQRVSDDEFLIALPSTTVDALLKHLSMYAKISHATIEKVALNVYVDLDAGQWLIKSEDIPNAISKEEFTQYRLDHNVPLLGVDYQVDEFILNVDHGQFVSFTKGCFLGQEPVSKVHNRSKPSKKLVVEQGKFIFVPNP